MAKIKISAREQRHIDELVTHYVDRRSRVEQALAQLRLTVEGNEHLTAIYHSLKWRTKEPDHLRDKLQRKLVAAKEKGKVFAIDADNLLLKITDLAGLRILHLHTQQCRLIDEALRAALDEASYTLQEGPIAKTWDDESRTYFKSIGFKTEDSATLYTSVHYVVKTSNRNPITCEIQVRTLMEEVWGEVDHTINYPHPSTSIACKEQIAALARVTSGCTRLVDSIFRSHEDLQGEA